MVHAQHPHSHAPDWHSTADWLELRLHLINLHGEQSRDIDQLTLDGSGTAGRRKNAELRHRARHSEDLEQAS
jgi:hypothetical protein